MQNLKTDELGRAFELPENQSIPIKDALSTHSYVLKNISSLLATSLGPNGLDKIIMSCDNEITITNDGATILREMEMTSNPIARLVLELSESQDSEIGDGTTSVVILASALLEEAVTLAQKGIHPIKICEGYNLAVEKATKLLGEIAITIDNVESDMLKAATTSLNSKIVCKGLDKFAKLCTKAVLNICDPKNVRDINLESIRLEKKIGKSIESTELIDGLVINKELSHLQMCGSVEDAKIAILSCPFELPKIKTKHDLLISTTKAYEDLQAYEKSKFRGMIESLKEIGANFVFCQWGFDDEANSLLMENGISAVRWVSGNDLESIAIYTNGSIIARFEDLSATDLGRGSVHESNLGTESEKIITIRSSNKNGTFLIRGGTELIMEECKRSIRDALCAVRNVILDSKVICGGGSSELFLAEKLKELSLECDHESCECFIAFSNALDQIPLNLARNSGLDAFKYISQLKERQINDCNPHLGVCCTGTSEDMLAEGVIESLNSKLNMIRIANNLVTMILKISDVVIDE